MKKMERRRSRRTIYYVEPRYQGAAALAFAGLLAAGGTVCGWLLDRDLGEALRDVSLQGHYPMTSAYEVVRELLVVRLVALFAAVCLAGSAMFLLLLRATLRGGARVVEVLRASSEGDLSTPSRVEGLSQFARLGEQIDLARDETLARLRAVRAEAASIVSGNLPPEEFRLRWDALKQKIREVAP